MTTMREKSAAFSCRDWPLFSRLVSSQHLSVWTRSVIENSDYEKVDKALKTKYEKEKKVVVEKKKEKNNHFTIYIVPKTIP